MEEGFCDLVSLTGAWPQKHCWEGTSGVLICEYFFLAYDSELRCSQENREQKMKMISVALPCFVRAGGCWWWDWAVLTVDSQRGRGGQQLQVWILVEIFPKWFPLWYAQDSELLLAAPGVVQPVFQGSWGGEENSAIKTVKSGNWSLALGSLSCVQISSGFAGFTLERRLSQCSSLQSGQTWFLFSSHHYYNDRE